MMIFSRPRVRSPLQAIVAEIADKHAVSVADLRSPLRIHKLVRARQEGYWRARMETDASLPQIARAFGRADHTTVFYGLRTYARRHGLPIRDTDHRILNAGKDNSDAR